MAPQHHTTLVDVFEHTTSRHAGRGLLRSRIGDAWHRETGSEWRRDARAWSRGLIAEGVQAGDRVMIIGETTPEWCKMEAAILLAGAVVVPVYWSHLAEDIAWTINDCDARVVVAHCPFQVEKLLRVRDKVSGVSRVVVFRDEGRRDRPDRDGRTELHIDAVVAPSETWVKPVSALAATGDDLPRDVLDERRAALTAETPCTFVYTSGTTGRPKGVVLDHGAFLAEIRAVRAALPIDERDALLLGLPLAHILARVVAWVSIACGAELVFPRSHHTLMQDLQETQPTVVPAVPSMLEDLQAKTVAEATTAGPLQRRIFERSVKVGLEVSQLRQQGQEPAGVLAARHALARKLVLDQLPARLGGRVRFLISGGAPLARDLAEWLHAFGLLVLEGYGLTETCAAVTVNRPERYKFGTVGLPLNGVDVALAEDGEVLIRGRSVMKGYHARPEDSAEVLDAEGWLHTGDIGELDGDGFLRITDRKKDIIVTAGGKNIAPQNIESHLKASPLLGDAMVYGDGRRFLSALVTLDERELKRWCAEEGVPYTTYAEVSQKPQVYRRVEQEIEDRNRRLASYETIRKFAVLDRHFELREGDLTPTGKIRRKQVTRRYRRLLDAFYSDGF